MTARNADGVTIDGVDEYEQTKIIFEKHKALIEAAGGKMSDFTKLTIFVTRIENNKQVLQARAEFFKGDFPACSLVEVSKLAAPNIYVEIEGIAHKGKGDRKSKLAIALGYSKYNVLLRPPRFRKAHHQIANRITVGKNDNVRQV